MSTLFFAVNQDPFDGSAHGLYCLRECRALAEAAPDKSVRLVYPGTLSTAFFQDRNHDQSFPEQLKSMGLTSPPNLRLHPLPALRRARGRRGVTINAVFFWACLLFLRRRMLPGDVLTSASFAGLTRFLFQRVGRQQGVRRVYEVHQLACMERGPDSTAAETEQAVFADADVLLTTTEVLRDRLQKLAPGKPVINLGLACGFDPQAVPPPEPDASRPFTLAYIGSLYPEQGVQWLSGVWEEVVKRVHAPVRLKVAGGSPREVEALREPTGGRQQMILVHGPIAPGDLSGFLRDVDALVIPALNRGRMPYVAITKAYDYLGLNRPILAANLPSIAEVLRQEREALLFPPEDASAVAEALARIMRDPDLAGTLTGHCRTRRGEFSWENRSNAWWRAVQS